jgi:hypothetical protein
VGRSLADLVRGERTERTMLPWVNRRSPKWEPEPLHWLGVNLGLQVMESADGAQDRSGKPARRAEILTPASAYTDRGHRASMTTHQPRRPR